MLAVIGFRVILTFLFSRLSLPFSLVQLREAILRLIGSGEDMFRTICRPVWEATHLVIPRPFPRLQVFDPSVIGTAWSINALEVLRLIQTREFNDIPLISLISLPKSWWLGARSLASDLRGPGFASQS